MSNGRFVRLWHLPASLQHTLRNLRQQKRKKRLVSNTGFAHISTSTGAEAAALVEGGSSRSNSIQPTKGNYIMVCSRERSQIP